jgi:hypothetical protein
MISKVSISPKNTEYLYECFCSAQGIKFLASLHNLNYVLHAWMLIGTLHANGCEDGCREYIGIQNANSILGFLLVLCKLISMNTS